MRRREFIVLAGSVLALPRTACAQQPAIPVIGCFSSRSPEAEAPIRVPFLKALEEMGFAAGRNVAIEYRFSGGRDERLPMLAAELVRREVALLVATDQHSAVAAQKMIVALSRRLLSARWHFLREAVLPEALCSA